MSGLPASRRQRKAGSCLSLLSILLACLKQGGTAAGLTSTALQEHDASGSGSAGAKAARRSRTSPAVSELSDSIQLEDW